MDDASKQGYQHSKSLIMFEFIKKKVPEELKSPVAIIRRASLLESCLKKFAHYLEKRTDTLRDNQKRIVITALVATSTFYCTYTIVRGLSEDRKTILSVTPVTVPVLIGKTREHDSNSKPFRSSGRSDSVKITVPGFRGQK